MSRLCRTYDGPTKIYFVTTNTHYRRKLFLDDRYAEIVVNTLFFIQKSKWIDLIAYVVMPDGLHVMFELIGRKNVSQVMHSVKSMVAYKISQRYYPQHSRSFHALAGRKQTRRGVSPHRAGSRLLFLIQHVAGEAPSMRKKYIRVWQKSFYDRVVDNEKYFNNLINYIHYNPVKDGLVKNPEDWAWLSHKTFLSKELS
ncbi:MAG: transposase [bacterium]